MYLRYLPSDRSSFVPLHRPIPARLEASTAADSPCSLEEHDRPGAPACRPIPSTRVKPKMEEQIREQDACMLPEKKPVKIREQDACMLPEKKPVKLKMAALRLHSTGVFSNVYRGTLISPGAPREIAVKKTWPDVGGSHKNLELLMLARISRDRHKNIVQVLFTFQTTGPDNKICESMICESMVFAFVPATLAMMVKDIGPPHNNLTDIKLYTWQLFNGLYYLAKRRIVHRDIKPQNLLIEPATGILKIADFGSAKIIKPNMESTAYQVTRFYRPPELLFEATNYTTTVDIWSAGCVVGEMLRGSVLFPGSCPKDQLTRIMNTIGSPDGDEVIAMHAPVLLEGERIRPTGFYRLLPHATPECIDFVQRILVYRPKYRLRGRELLLDPFFDELFAPGRRRRNGQLVSSIITPEDIQKLRTPKKHKKSRNLEFLKLRTTTCQSESASANETK
uniref:Protein kinase domain-containing protein n=1 Tax=Steinernema glaseri TaxID=37863 RepID=A0A1I8AQU2_9BILA